MTLSFYPTPGIYKKAYKVKTTEQKTVIPQNIPFNKLEQIQGIYEENRVGHYGQDITHISDTVKKFASATASNPVTGVVMDIETLGDINGDFFATTEIGLKGFKYKGAKEASELIPDSFFSIVAKPDTKSYDYLKEVLVGMQNTKKPSHTIMNGVVRPLTNAEYRAVNDLTRYSGKNIFEDKLIGSEKDGIIVKVLNTKAAERRSRKKIFGSTIKAGDIGKALQGLENLNQATHMADVAFAMDVYQDILNPVTNITYNGSQYDYAHLAESFNRIDASEISSRVARRDKIGSFISNRFKSMEESSFDLMVADQALITNRSVIQPSVSDPIALNAMRIIEGRNTEGGIRRLQALARLTSGKSGAFHLAHVDIDFTQGYFEDALPLFSKILKDENSRDFWGIKPGDPKRMLRYLDPKQLQSKAFFAEGTTLFTKKGISFNDDRFFGRKFGYEFDKSGELVLKLLGEEKGKFKPGQGDALNRSAYYKVLGFGEAELDGRMHRTLSVYNMDTDTIQVIASNEHFNIKDPVKRLKAQEKSLTEMLYRNTEVHQDKLYPKEGISNYGPFVNAKGAIDYTQESIDRFNAVSEDNAMRDYRKFFTLEHGGQFDRFNQSYTAIDVLTDFKKKRIQGGKTTTDKYSILQDILKSTEIYEDMNGVKKTHLEKLEEIFSGPITGGKDGATYRFTQPRLKNFIYMSDYLEETKGFFNPILESLNAENSGLNLSQKSIALMRYEKEIQKKYGGKTKVRQALPFEKDSRFFLPVFDPNGSKIDYGDLEVNGRTISVPKTWKNNNYSSVNFTDVESARKGLSSIIYAAQGAKHINNPSNPVQVLLGMYDDFKTRGLIPGRDADPSDQARARMLRKAIEGSIDNQAMAGQFAEELAGLVYSIKNRPIAYGGLKPEIEYWNAVPTNKKEYTVGQLATESITDLGKIARTAIKDASILGDISSDGSLSYGIDDVLSNVFTEHTNAASKKKARYDKQTQRLFENGKTYGSSHINYIGKTDAFQAYDEVVKSYRNAGFEVNLMFNPDNESKNLVMALADPKNADAFKRMTFDEMLEANNVVMLNLPYLNSSGLIHYTGKEIKNNQNILGLDSNNKLTMSFGIDYALEETRHAAGRIRETFLEDGAYAAEQTGKRRLRNTFDYLSGAQSKYLSAQDAAKLNKNPNNRLIALDKSDVTIYGHRGFVKDYFDNKLKTTHSESDKMRINRLLRKEYDLSVDDLMPSEVKELREQILKRPVYTSSNNDVITVGDLAAWEATKEGEAVSWRVSFGNPTNRLPFGQLMSGATQRLRQANQYVPMTRPGYSTAEPRSLQLGNKYFTQVGMFDHLLNRPSVQHVNEIADLGGTILGKGKRARVSGKETSGLYLRTAYMDDIAIQDRMSYLEQQFKNNGTIDIKGRTFTKSDFMDLQAIKFSTYDGQFGINKDIMGLYDSVGITEIGIGEKDFVFNPDLIDPKDTSGKIKLRSQGKGDKVLVGGVKRSISITASAKDPNFKSYMDLTTSDEYLEKLAAKADIDKEYFFPLNGVRLSKNLDDDGNVKSIRFSADYIEGGADSTVWYRNKYDANVSAQYEGSGKDITVKSLQIEQIKSSRSGDKYLTRAGFKGTAQELEERFTFMLTDGEAEAIMDGIALKKISPGETLENTFNRALELIHSADGKGMTANKRRKAYNEIYSIVKEYDDTAVLHRDGNIVMHKNPNVTVGNVEVASMIGRADKVTRTYLNRGLGYSWNDGSKDHDIRVDSSQIRRSDVGEILHSIGKTSFSPDAPIFEREGVVRFGRLEVDALSGWNINGQKMDLIADVYKSHIKDRSTMLNPELGSDAMGTQAWYDPEKRRYYSDDYVQSRKARGLGNDYVPVNNKIEAYNKIFAGGDGVTISSDGYADDFTKFANGGAENAVISRGLFYDTTKSRYEGRDLRMEDYKGTIVDAYGRLDDIGQSKQAMTKVGQELGDLTEEGRLGVNKVKEQILKQGGYYLKLHEPILVPGAKGDVSMDKIWMVNDDVRSIGSGNKSVVTVGELTRNGIRIDALNQELGQINDGTDTWAKLHPNKKFNSQNELNAHVKKRREDIITSLSDEIVNYKSLASSIMGGSDGMLAQANSARLDFSGHFRVKIISPTELAKNGLQDSQIYMGSDAFKGITNGMATYNDILDLDKVVKGDDKAIALINRYPTMGSQSTNPVVVNINDAMKLADDQVAITPGVLGMLMGDADGDFVGINLSHYNIDTYGKNGNYPKMRNAITQFKQASTAAQEEYSKVGRNIYDKMNKVYEKFGMSLENMDMSFKGLTSSVQFIAGITGGQELKIDTINSFFDTLSAGGYKDKDGQALKALKEFVSGNNPAANDIAYTVGQMQNNIVADSQQTLGHSETAKLARISREGIGGKANAAFKLQEMSAKMVSLSKEGFYTEADHAIVENMTQAFAQGSINTKSTRFAIEKSSTLGEIRQFTNDYYEGLGKMEDALLTGDKKTALELSKQYNILDDISDTRVKNSQIHTIDDYMNTLDKIREVYRLGSKETTTLKQLLHSPAMNLGISGGAGYEGMEELNTQGPRMSNSLVDTLLTRTSAGQNGHVDVNESLQKSMQMAESKFGMDNAFQMHTVGGDVLNNITDAAGRSNIFSTLGEGILSNSGMQKTVAGTAVFAGIWAISAALRESPIERAKRDKTNPDEFVPTQEQGSSDYYSPQPNVPGPTARITPAGQGYENLAINIKASNLRNMSNNDIIALIQNEMQNQSPVQMNVSSSQKDSSSKVNKQWVNDIVNRSTRYGLGWV